MGREVRLPAQGTVRDGGIRARRVVMTPLLMLDGFVKVKEENQGAGSTDVRSQY